MSQCWHTIHGQQRLVVFQISLCILRKLEPLGKKLYACLTVSNYCVFSPLVALSFILGTKLKSACDRVTECMLRLEIQRGKAGMVLQQHSELGGVKVCCLQLVEEIAVPRI